MDIKLLVNTEEQVSKRFWSLGLLKSFFKYYQAVLTRVALIFYEREKYDYIISYYLFYFEGLQANF